MLVYRSCNANDFSDNSEDSDVSVSTTAETTTESLYNVTLQITYQPATNLTQQVCNIYVDKEIVYKGHGSGTTATVDLELKAGKYSLRVRTSNWGLVSGSETNAISFEVEKDTTMNFTYEYALLEFKLWNSN